MLCVAVLVLPENRARRAKANKINFGSWALGSSAHIFAQSLNEQYGLAIEVVTYKGEAPMWQDMGAGSLQAAMGSPQAMNALLVKADVRPIVAPSRVRGALVIGAMVGVMDNVINNLPLGLIAGSTLNSAHVHGAIQNAVLIGIDLGPNLSVTGSLATILWLMAMRREGLHVGFGTFFKAGVIAMPVALGLGLVSAAWL